MAAKETTEQRDLRIALYLAAKHHLDQTDKLGKPYLGHLLRVAAKVSAGARAAALLHDILEDTDVGVAYLYAMGISKTTVKAVVLLTRQPGESYTDYIENIANAAGPEGRIAREVKWADLGDNLSAERRYPGDEANRAKYEESQKTIADGVC